MLCCWYVLHVVASQAGATPWPPQTGVGYDIGTEAFLEFSQVESRPETGESNIHLSTLQLYCSDATDTGGS